MSDQLTPPSRVIEMMSELNTRKYSARSMGTLGLAALGVGLFTGLAVAVVAMVEAAEAPPEEPVDPDLARSRREVPDVAPTDDSH